MTASNISPSRGLDATTLLTVYVVLLLTVPAPMVISPLGTAGGLSTVLAISTFFLWFWFQAARSTRVSTGRQPVRAALLAWVVVMFVVYAHAMSQPIPSDEISPADSGMLRLIGMSGIVLAANEGIPTLIRHRALAKRLVIAVGIAALLGIVQAVTKQLWVDRITIPGLTSGAAEWTLAARSGLARPSGTSTHPIEYGMVLTTVLPLAIALARSAPSRRWLYRILVCAIGISVLLAISRSAMVCAAVAVLVMGWSWPLMTKLRALLSIAVLTTIAFLTVPGLLGTITNLFTGIGDDSSVQSRTGSYELASEFIGRSPLLGRGFGTFLPKYWILDNGYLGLLIEGGVLGLIGLLALIVVGVSVAHRAARHAVDPIDREIARALVASIAAGAAGLAFFDTFSFPQSAGVFFVLIGLAGAAWRLNRPVGAPDTSANPDEARSLEHSVAAPVTT
ncbi:MAG: O-antigen ligase family protein [Microbacteriaceae bacterium]